MRVGLCPSATALNGRKDDSGKLRWSLVPWSAMRDVVSVLMHGAAKYGDENWRQVLACKGGQARYFDAAMRHLMAWRANEPTDDESGRSHLAHAVCCMLFLLADDGGTV
jgi:Domain of unknown function (DUF5664)